MVVIVIMVAALVRAGLTSVCGRGYWDGNRGGHSLICCGGHDLTQYGCCSRH